MCSRADALVALPPRVRLIAGSSRLTTRTRSGAHSGAPDSRGARFASAARTWR